LSKHPGIIRKSCKFLSTLVWGPVIGSIAEFGRGAYGARDMRKALRQAGPTLSTLALLVTVAPTALLAQGVILKNDSFASGQAAMFQSGFAAGEAGAVRLAPGGPFPAEITAVQFLFGGAAGTHTVTLRIWEDSAGTVAPGTEVFSGDFLVTASDSALQEIDLGDASILISGPFRVGIEFQHDGLPSIARDTDGTIAPDRNFIYAGFWADSMLFGLTGDWIIRARVGPLDPIFQNGFE
jgi:hypothetical protein